MDVPGYLIEIAKALPCISLSSVAGNEQVVNRWLWPDATPPHRSQHLPSFWGFPLTDEIRDLVCVAQLFDLEGALGPAMTLNSPGSFGDLSKTFLNGHILKLYFIFTVVESSGFLSVIELVSR